MCVWACVGVCGRVWVCVGVYVFVCVTNTHYVVRTSLGVQVGRTQTAKWVLLEITHTRVRLRVVGN